MKRSLCTFVFAVAFSSLSLVAGENALRAEGWSLSKLNPFRSKATPKSDEGGAEKDRRSRSYDDVDLTSAEEVGADELESEEIDSVRIEDPLEEPLEERGDEAPDESDDDNLGDDSLFDDSGSAEDISRDSPKRSKAAKTAAKPSAWNRFTSGGKNMLERTGEVLNPFDGKPAKKAPPKPLTGGRTYSGTRMSKKTEEKPSFFSSIGSWMKPKEEEKESRTVTDFLGRPRPY